MNSDIPDIKLFARSLFRIKPSEKYGGIGLFAVRAIEPGDVIAKWEDLNEELFFSWQDFETLDDATKEMVLDFCAQAENGFYAPSNINLISLPWHMNHCCDGNVGFNMDGDFVAIKNVVRDEELTYDYGLMITNPTYKLVCKCGMPNCRNLITGNDWKDPDFRERNLGHMTPEIHEMIDLERLMNNQDILSEPPAAIEDGESTKEQIGRVALESNLHAFDAWEKGDATFSPQSPTQVATK